MAKNVFPDEVTKFLVLAILNANGIEVCDVSIRIERDSSAFVQLHYIDNQKNLGKFFIGAFDYNHPERLFDHFLDELSFDGYIV